MCHQMHWYRNSSKIISLKLIWLRFVFRKRNLKIWNSIKDKVVFGADVRSTLNYVITENSDIAIVYASDILSTSLKPIKIIPKDSYSNIIYPATIIKNSKNQAESEKFLQHLLSESSQKIFYKYGFNQIKSIQ